MIPLIERNARKLQLEIPQHLHDVLAANRHLIPKFLTRVQQSVEQSFQHPDTRLRGEVRDQEIRLRVNLCYEALRQMYHEAGMSLLHALDILPSVVIDALRMGSGIQNQVLGADGNRWTVPDDPGMILSVDDDDLNAEDCDTVDEDGEQ